MYIDESSELPLGKFSLLAPHDGVRASFSTRRGGVSEAPFDSLNLGMNTGDSAEHVTQNRELFAAAVRIEPKKTFFVRQVHSSIVYLIDGETAAQGGDSHVMASAEADALVTNVKGATLATQAADCLLLVLYDPVKEVIANVHASWRGTVGHIAGRTVDIMADAFETNPAEVIVGCTAAISQEHYEVRDDFLRAAEPMLPGLENYLARRGGKIYFDLEAANRAQLEACGVKKEHIEPSGHCTFAEEKFFYSYRRDGKRTGRMLLAATLQRKGETDRGGGTG